MLICFYLETNLGQKVNVAEISIDENEYDIPDIDSTPGNNVDGEDDQDNAIVVLSIKTGSSPLYITLITLVTAIMGTGLYLIYKYVVKKIILLKHPYLYNINSVCPYGNLCRSYFNYITFLLHFQVFN